MDEKNMFLTSELSARYQISRSLVYKWMKTLRISMFKENGKSYITGEQLQLMDDLHAHLEISGNTAEFVNQCIESGRIIFNKQIEESVAIVQSQQQEIARQQPQELTTSSEKIEIDVEASQADLITEIQQQKKAAVQGQDIQKTAQSARDRAFAKAVAEESLLLIYEATEDFTPEQKQQLEKHRTTCDQARKGRGVDVNDFLQQAIAMSGLSSSPPLSSNNASVSA